MAKTKISEFSATPGNNTDIDGINIAEGCAPSGINDAIRELMAQLKDFQTGAAGDSFNGPVGTTTAAAGAFTTLSASGAVTLSGGTANGVAYLNGSKVLTTGSALTFDGSQLDIPAGTAAAPSLSTPADPDTGVFFPAANQLAASVGGAEGLRLTSTGLGIGTSSPLSKLHVNGDIRTDGDIDLIGGAGTPEIRMYQNSGNWAIQNSAGNLLFYDMDAAATRVTVDGSGNLGLGVTPSAWASGWKVLQVGATASFSDNNQGDLYLGSNWRFDGTGDKYITNNYANLYRQENGAHSWLNAPSGTAGNAISFTQAMTLDASGNLLVGTTSGGSGRLRVSGSGDAFNAPYASPSAAYFWSSNSGDSNCVEIYQGRFNKVGLTMSNNNTGTVTQIDFVQTGTSRGSITTNNSTTAYNTSSDYRLKDNIQPMTGALAFVRKQRPVTYNWKADGSEGAGYIAHWMQEDGAGNCVTGTKDAVDAEGKPVYQGIDTSFMVAPLNAAINELADIVEAQAAIIEQLKADVAALKAAA